MAIAHLLISRPTEGEDVTSWERTRAYSPIFIGALALVGGALGIWRCQDSLGLRFSEALFIAGCLSLTVDLYLKTKLQRDAAKDIFYHLLGVNLPIEIKESLRDTVLRNTVYRKDVLIEARAARLDDLTVRLEVSMSATVVAISNTEYRQLLQFEDAEQPSVLEMSATSTTKPKISYNLKNVKLDVKDDEPEVLEWQGRKIKLRRNEELHTHARFTIEGSTRDFWVINFGNPVIHARVRVYGDEDDLTVTASWADQVNANEYLYQKVFVTGDHLQIRWKPKMKKVV